MTTPETPQVKDSLGDINLAKDLSTLTRASQWSLTFFGPDTPLVSAYDMVQQEN